MIRVDPVIVHGDRIRKTHPERNIHFFKRPWVFSFCALGK